MISCRKQSEGINYIVRKNLTFDKFWQKSRLSLFAKSIKIIFVNLSNKLTQSQLDEIF